MSEAEHLEIAHQIARKTLVRMELPKSERLSTELREALASLSVAGSPKDGPKS